MAHDAFISHSSKDKATANAITAILESKGIRCWIAPRDNQPDGDGDESIMTALGQARVMVLVFSGRANESRHIKREADRAVDKGISIIPFRIENVMPTGSLELSISTTHWLDAFTPPLEQHAEHLAAVILALMHAPTSEQMPMGLSQSLPKYRPPTALPSGIPRYAPPPGPPPRKPPNKMLPMALGLIAGLLVVGALVYFASHRAPDLTAAPPMTEAPDQPTTTNSMIPPPVPPPSVPTTPIPAPLPAPIAPPVPKPQAPRRRSTARAPASCWRR